MNDIFYKGGGGSAASSSAGGSGIMLGVEKGSYTFDAAAGTITITGMPTLSLKEILQVVNLADNLVIYNGQIPGKGGSIAGNILTLDFDTSGMDNSDPLQIYVQYNNSEDYSTGSKKVSVLNMDSLPPIDAEHPVEALNLAAGTYRLEIPMDSHRNLALHLICSGGVTMQLEASNDPDAVSGVDVTSELLGVASVIDSEKIFFLKDIMPAKLFVVYTTADADNAIDVFIRKY